MAALAPIPRRMLPLSCTVRTEDGAAFLLDGVGLEYEQAVSDDAHRSADAGGGTLFVDAASTRGALEVPAGSYVEVEGCTYLVAECRRYLGPNGRVHHWELVLR